MKSTKFYKDGGSKEIPEDIIESIIRVAYGDAGFRERIKIAKLAGRHQDIKNLLSEYRETADSVKSIKKDECPDELLSAISAKTEYDNSPKPSVMLDVYTTFFTKPGISFAALSIIAVIIMSVSFNLTNSYSGYDKAEIEQANRQAKYAFAIINKVFTSTRNSLAKDILTDKVSKPINEGIKTVNNLFNEEVKK